MEWLWSSIPSSAEEEDALALCAPEGRKVCNFYQVNSCNFYKIPGEVPFCFLGDV